MTWCFPFPPEKKLGSLEAAIFRHVFPRRGEKLAPMPAGVPIFEFFGFSIRSVLVAGMRELDDVGLFTCR